VEKKLYSLFLKLIKISSIRNSFAKSGTILNKIKTHSVLPAVAGDAEYKGIINKITNREKLKS
jgi:hypothetical protein